MEQILTAMKLFDEEEPFLGLEDDEDQPEDLDGDFLADEEEFGFEDEEIDEFSLDEIKDEDFDIGDEEDDFSFDDDDEDDDDLGAWDDDLS